MHLVNTEMEYMISRHASDAEDEMPPEGDESGGEE